MPAPDEQTLLDELRVRLVEPAELPRFQRLLHRLHYLKSLKPVGERLYYVATNARGEWLGLLIFNAAAKRLFVRELCDNARRSLQAEHLKADLARVEAKVPVRCSLPVKEIESIAHQFKQVPEYRNRY